MATVLITDYAWPDCAIEARILAEAGHRLVVGSQTAPPAREVETLVAEAGPQAIMTCWAEVDERALDAAPDLKVVARLGVGLDNIAVEACTGRGIWVTNVPDYCVEDVSDHAIALLLAWSRGVVAFDRSVKSGFWEPAAARLRRLSEVTVGVLGYGRIGRRTVSKLAPWGSRILVYNRTKLEQAGFEQAPLDVVLRESDAVILHLPLEPATHHILDAAAFSAMKPGAFLINVSRGPLVDNSALEAALEGGTLSGAGLDVIEGEPSPPPAIIARHNVIATPHIAFSSDTSLIALRKKAAQSVVSALSGRNPPMNACNRPQSPRSR